MTSRSEAPERVVCTGCGQVHDTRDDAGAEGANWSLHGGRWRHYHRGGEGYVPADPVTEEQGAALDEAAQHAAAAEEDVQLMAAMMRLSLRLGQVCGLRHAKGIEVRVISINHRADWSARFEVEWWNGGARHTEWLDEEALEWPAAATGGDDADAR